jgi:hypothetical protein
LASPGGRPSTACRYLLLEAGNSSQCSVRGRLRLSGNVIPGLILHMAVRYYAHASLVRGRMGRAGDAVRRGHAPLASVGLDRGHCPGGYARIDSLDRLAVSPEISDREISPGTCRGSNCSRAGRLISSECRTVPVSRLNGGSRHPHVKHMQLFSPASVRNLLQAAGFADIDVRNVYNRYPVRYWAQLFPFPKAIKARLLGLLRTTRLGSPLIPLACRKHGRHCV